MKRALMAALLLVTALTSVDAYAQTKNPLDGQPAVRKRIEYLPKRFELQPELGLTYLQDFRHYFLIGLKAEYHIIEYLSVGLFFDYAVVGWDTGLTTEIRDTLPANIRPQDTWVDPSPSKAIMYKALDKIMFQAGAYVAYTPWFGKLSLFGKLFSKFDVTVLAGAGFVMLKQGKLARGCDGDVDPEGVCQRGVLHVYQDEKNGGNNGGFRVGPLVGVGLRFFFLKWLALSVNLRAIFIERNQAGFDKNGDTRPNFPTVLLVDKKDNSWEPVMSFNIGVSFFFPLNAPTSR
jgi:outer membrane beta-barrel protein